MYSKVGVFILIKKSVKYVSVKEIEIEIEMEIVFLRIIVVECMVNINEYVWFV